MVAMTLAFAGCEDDFGSEHDRGNNGGGSGGGAATGTINGHDYVDLGLPSGLKWATCNVGANSPEGYGNYYAWGETTTKTSYTEDNSLTYGRDMGDISGNVNYDAARANWGSTWRMPTKAEMQELDNNCTWTWTTQNGVNGHKVTGPNGNSIFLPAAGSCYESSRYGVGENGRCWSSTPDESNFYDAYRLGLYGIDGCDVIWGSRYNGFTVRPVSGTINYGTTDTEELPTVTTNSVTSITKNSAVCGGNVTSDGGATVTRRGVCWSTSSNPTVYDNKTIDGNGEGSFSSNITELEAGTTYYVRAYATNSEGTAYGIQKTFTTTTSSGGGGATTGTINGHEWVDLGLPSGTKWATCNIGATTPEGYGSYYAWGETSTKSEYTIENYRILGANISIDISGNSSYDAARANWGGSWRMPTYGEMKELKNNCTWTWTTQNGVNGMRVTGPNGNSIFLPAAGYCSGSSRYYVGEDGYYWNSLRSEITPTLASCLHFTSGNHGFPLVSRVLGHTVRPVSD